MCTLNGEMCTLECVCLDEATYARLRGMCTLGDETWRDTVGCGEMQRGAAICGEIQWDVARCSEVRRDAARRGVVHSSR